MVDSERSEIVHNAMNVDEREAEDLRLKKRDAAMLIGMCTVATVTTGIFAAVISKRKFKQFFPNFVRVPENTETGVSLAIKALCYSTLLTVGIFSTSIFCICKFLDINNLEELRKKLRRPGTINPGDRTEFENFSDFIQYLNNESNKKKQEKN